ncbi:hypothetical protein [Faecalibacillus intestinalis]
MKEVLKIICLLLNKLAIKENGLDAYCSPIRGGTDGAHLWDLSQSRNRWF